MTAEIAVLNKEAVALAADSAVTSEYERGQKILLSGNKIFALSKYAPVAIMVFGNAKFMKVPWETIVKIYRRKLGKREFATLNEHAEDFIRSLETEAAALYPAAQQKSYAELAIYASFYGLKERIERAVEAQTEKGPLTPEQLAALVSSIIKRRRDAWQKAERVATLPDDFGVQVVKDFVPVIDEARHEIFEELPLSEEDVKILHEIVGFLFERWIPGGSRSGIVVAGYGRDEIFPALRAFDVEGVVNGRLKYKATTETNITHDMGASIRPFAQREMVHTFMEGIDPDLDRAIDEAVAKIIADLPSTIVDSINELGPERKEELKKQFATVSIQELEKYREKLGDHRREKFVDPVLDVVSMLPKDELAALAESLVNLTSLKRRVSPEAETVAGPIDVAVISKGDGLIWIKRKHYFARDLNPQFFANYLREDTDAETGGSPGGEGGPEKSGRL